MSIFILRSQCFENECENVLLCYKVRFCKDGAQQFINVVHQKRLSRINFTSIAQSLIIEKCNV